MAAEQEEIHAIHDVALFNPGEKEKNTIVLGGVDVIIPLELDVDGDPLQDDAVCLRSASGNFEDVRLSSDEHVTAAADKRHLYYPFLDVPAGLYCVDVRIGQSWVNIQSNLLVVKGTAYWNGKPMEEDLPADNPSRHDPHELVERSVPEAAGDSDCPCGS